MEEGDLFNESNKNSLDDHDLVLGKFLHQPAFSSESESLYPPNNVGSCLSFEDTTTDNNYSKLLTKSNSSNSIASQHVPQKVVTATATSPTSYVLSFDESTVNGKKCKANSSDQSKGDNISTSRKSRNSLESLNHIMAERKRRQELTERFIALSATIPGLKKIDKASILSEAITYVKQLKKRVKDLEEQRCYKKIRVESVSFINKANFYSDEGSVSSEKTNFDDSHEVNVALPEVEARVLEKEVLIRIHCKNQNGTMLKILTHLKSLDLSTISNSVLPFGNSVLDITIIAQMGDKYNLAVKELVKSLRLALLESRDVYQ
ncbi:hypothetical protein TanjilG_30149 [Lupinus angustifolius]|uniref:BHLH domain-containing protein n=2 Tax=Lupinus angustifolius TaxID=3871 RepID=A0A4P1R6P0_LUPAN|nr:hypothetical protein TanjilG_30149 [Lupinus angustifolius]